MAASTVRILFVVLCALLTSVHTGCSTAPTVEQLANADFGLQPSEPAAKAAAEAYIRSRLKDPYSAVFTWGSLDKGWFTQRAAISDGVKL